MISRRNYFTIFLMMMILLFMFQFSMIIKENGNEYDTNEYQLPELATGSDAWEMKPGDSPSDFENGGYVLFVGAKDSAVCDTVREWCTYTKRNLLTDISLNTCTIEDGHLPEILLVDGKSVNVPVGMQTLENAAEHGVTVIFCSLPDTAVIEKDTSLRAFLGIEEVRGAETDIEGVRLFDGFLLGGEAIYKAGTPEDEEKLQDFDLTVPWYITGKGTKTYMVGLKDDKVIEREDFPHLIWRNSLPNAMVFAIEGDFCESLTGLGILDACVYESSDFQIYPIINGQCTVLADYPSFAAENEAEMERVYARTAESVMRDIMWPSLVSMSARNDLLMTCCMQTKYDYSDPAQPSDAYLVFYLQQLKEAGAEAGKSFDYTGDISVAEKIEADREFYRDAHCKYTFGACYVNSLSEELKDVFGNDSTGIHTLTCADREDLPLLSYYTDYVTLLGVTNRAEEYTYKKDLQMRSLATALGYSNLLIDMHRVVWPESDEDHWQNYFDKVFSNISTYYSKSQYFEQAAMSTCDARARALLNADYKITTEGNKIKIHIDNLCDEAYYLLRTHGEQIEYLVGGGFEQIQPDVYILHLTYEDVSITLGRSENVFQYDGPF